jgi:hypothetical protein
MAGTGSDGTLGGIGKAFLAIAVEITLATVLFFLILGIAHVAERYVASMNDPEGSALYYVGKAGEYVLLGVDCVIGLLFVSRGIVNAWKETWGKR